MKQERLDFHEFFAGGGMARLGLGRGWRCTMANDICEKKAAAYRANFPPARELLLRDVRLLSTKHLPGEPMLAWASFPCQDLSLAGDRRGLAGKRSGTFWPFWELMAGMNREGRPVPLIVLENVIGALTSHGGRDLCAILQAMFDAGYRFGPLVIDAALFVPQSRPRLFIVAAKEEYDPLPYLVRDGPSSVWHTRALLSAYGRLPGQLRDYWVWWNLPVPPPRSVSLQDLVEDVPTGVTWHTPEETERLLAMMSEVNRAKVEEVRRRRQRTVGTVYKRTRPDDTGGRVQRAEVRFDQTSGCLRTPVGGSSRQTVLVVEGRCVRSRLLSPREAARLMGVPDRYRLPGRYNEAYHLMGDGLVVPVVSWIERHILRPVSLGGVTGRRRVIERTDAAYSPL